MIEAQPTRSDGRPFPCKNPAGWLHLSEALTLVAVGMFNPEYGEVPQFYRDTMLLFSKAGTDGDDDRRLRDHIAEQFCKACFEGNILTGFRPIGGGGLVQPLDPDWWELEDPNLPFQSWGYDPADVFNATPPNWIFVDAASARRVSEYGFGRRVAPVIFHDSSELISVREALNLLEQFLPERLGPPPPLGAPDGAQELKTLCETGVVTAYADRMARAIRADERGLNGIECEAQPRWPIPPHIWKGVAMSPVQNWAAGNFVSKPDGRNTYRIDGVSVDHRQLLEHLESIGRLWRAQWRIRWNGEGKDDGEGEVVHYSEGFVLPDDRPRHDEVPHSSTVAPPAETDAPKIGRPAGTFQYETDPAIIEEVVSDLDGGAFHGPGRLTKAIKSKIARIEPANLTDEAKVKRIRKRVLSSRPDLAT